MNTGLRKLTSLTFGIGLILLGGATVGFAQTVDSDTELVGLVVTWECALASESVNPASEVSLMSAAAPVDAAAGTGPGSCQNESPDSDGNVPPPVIPDPEDGNPPPSAQCPDAAASLNTGVILVSGLSLSAPSSLAAVSNSMQGECPDSGDKPPPLYTTKSVPVVTQLPETGVSPQTAAAPWTLTTMLAAGVLLMIGGSMSFRASVNRRVG